ncbi:MAG: transposase family protein, partial [Patescibacteria group bacterium]|nr:transposase family protein [Patescibacteria group bacterium]
LLKLFIPKKGNRWHKLTEEDKAQNRILNRIRVKIEHSILKCKRFKILAQTYRHSLKDYHQRFQIIAGIINFQLPNKENLIPVTMPAFDKKEIVFSKV